MNQRANQLDIRMMRFPDDAQVWDSYVNQHPDSTFFHLASWHRIVSISYPSFKPLYLIAYEDGECVGLLPAFLVNRPFVGSAVISNPFSVSAGPLATTAQIAKLLVEHLVTEASHRNCDYVELRDPIYSSQLSDAWRYQTQYSGFAKSFDANPDAILMAIPNRQRAVLRKAQKLALDLDIHDDIQRFLKTYRVSLRNLGTPIYPVRYFAALKEYFPENFLLASVKQGTQDLTTVLCFTFKQSLMPYYGGGIPEARQSHSFPWMYWQLMQYGVEHGFLEFDFGRSPNGSGAFSFKKNLGFTPREMSYAFLALQGSTVPQLHHENPLVHRLTSIWSRLPLPLTRLLGPVGAIYAV